ncbi:MAG TPA: response regulator transcription factor [Gaiellaceae bacterium]|nr:response regulator transcription factor [Gaiellaceae bacterium]
MSKRILIVEDEELIAKAVAFAFRREGYETETARDGEAALEAARARPPDALIVDIVLPGELSGSDVCSILRRETIAPILMLTARAGVADRVLGFERGADDYVTKPFMMHELIARVRAHLRRAEFNRAGSTTTLRRLGELTLDTMRREVTVGGEPVHLTVSEFQVLALLTERPGEVVSRQELVARLWSNTFDGETRTCDAHVRRLRAKIEENPASPRRVVTVRGVGYKFVG